jgi:predicted dienelactone hydrolase
MLRFPLLPGVVLAVLVTASTIALPAAAQAPAPETQGRIAFGSFTPKTMFDLAREQRQNWTDQEVWGDLSLPKGAAGKVPAIVLMHGSGGVDRGMAQWVAAFDEIGVATFVVDVFGPRGVRQTVENQALVPNRPGSA